MSEYKIWICIEKHDDQDLEALTVNESQLLKTYETEEAAANAALQFEHDTFAVEQIHDLMSGKMWSAETLDRIADIIRQTGREVKNAE